MCLNRVIQGQHALNWDVTDGDKRDSFTNKRIQYVFGGNDEGQSKIDKDKK